MQATLMNAQDWAQTEFGSAELGDRRRAGRLVKVAEALCEHAQGTLPGSFESWAELKAAYRLLAEPDVGYEQILAPHQARVRAQCRPPGEYLLVEDTTELDFTTHEATSGLGRIGNDSGRGLWLHSMLALRVEGRDAQQAPRVTALGLPAQQYWARTMPPIGNGKETNQQRLARERESRRWAAAVKQLGPPPAGVSWTFIADRESDIYEVFVGCQEQGWGFIVRANQPRALAEEAGSILTAVSAAPVLGRFTLDLRSRPRRYISGKRKGRPGRIRPAQPARQAELEIRACTVQVRGPWRPGGRLEAQPLNVVEAKEVNPPPDAEPIHWVLLTNWPGQDFTQALRVVQAYARRWLIEEYHKCLKTGTKIEASQLATARGLGALLGILAVVAVRLLNRKLLAVTVPDQAVDTAEVGSEVLAILEAKYGRPKGGWTNESYLRAVARLGGFLARKGDGSPGWLVLWRGWDRLLLMQCGFELGRSDKCG